MSQTKSARKSNKKSAKRIGVLFSGGMDSAALISVYLKQGYEVWPLYVKCGLPWEKTELAWAQRFLKKIRSRQLKKLIGIRLLLEGAYRTNWSITGKTPGAHSRDEAVFLPARNLLLATKSLLFLSSKEIYRIAFGTLKGNPFADGRRSYFSRLEKLLSQSFERKVKISVPFRNRTKAEVIRMSANVPLYLSLSCINPRGKKHCGKCNKCAERKKAFKQAGVMDRTDYVRA